MGSAGQGYPVRAAKAEVRRRVEAAIAALPATERAARGARAQERMAALPEFAAARIVLLYHSMRGEIETSVLITRALRDGKRVALPRTDRASGTMRAVEIRNPAADLFRGSCGAMEPHDGLPEVAPGEIDLAVVPGRAFDIHGRRLGRGAGYYDRYMSSPGFRAIRVALAFDCQVLDSIPALPHDLPVDIIVTESRVIECRASRRDGSRE
ncbi:MAG: 5-formyltetrahydrofolate cyclo-ligase [Planctomycetota bacterium]|nr:5-formyltetrahydrofolate cyclo-ligase [Planctomycetota bacterium]